jgi:MFS family permease
MIQSIGLLLALRILQGFIVGVYMAVVSVYICEVTPFDLHGSEGVWSQILIVLGVVLCYVFKVAFTEQNVGT